MCLVFSSSFQIDFDKWKSPEDFEEETRDILQDRPDILRQLQEDEGVIEPSKTYDQDNLTFFKTINYNKKVID